jgi:predicted ABC-type exoprotein transport system permease subunit
MITLIVIVQLFFVGIFVAVLFSNRKQVNVLPFGAVGSIVLLIAILFLVGYLRNLPARSEIIMILSNPYAWFIYCNIVLVILFLEILLGPDPWRWETIEKKAKLQKNKKKKEGKDDYDKLG